MEQTLNTFEVFYTSEISVELDESIKTFIKEYLQQNFQINVELYYTEFTTITPTHRLIGFELSRALEELERLQTIDALILEFDAFVKPQ